MGKKPTTSTARSQGRGRGRGGAAQRGHGRAKGAPSMYLGKVERPASAIDEPPREDGAEEGGEGSEEEDAAGALSTFSLRVRSGVLRDVC
jgi:hypothetical protein